MKKHKLWGYKGADKPHKRPYKGHKEKEKETVTVKEEETVLVKVKEKEKKRPIYHLIEEAFLAKNQDFNFKREGPHLVQLERKALARPNPEAFIKKAIVVFWNLTQSNDDLFKDQPFLPSIMNSGGLWPRVVKRMGKSKITLSSEKVDAIAKEIQK